MGKAQDFFTEKGTGGGSVAIEEVQKDLAHGDWGRIATQKFNELKSYWFDDGSRLISGRFDSVAKNLLFEPIQPFRKRIFKT